MEQSAKNWNIQQDECEIYINLNKFQDLIMKYSISDDFEKMFQNTIFYNEKESTKFFQAMQHGFIWAGILAGTSELKHYYLKGVVRE